MHEEVSAAVVFLTRLVKRNEKLSGEKVEQFSSKLSEILVERFKDHWYTNTPSKGQAYRSAKSSWCPAHYNILVSNFCCMMI